MGFRELNLGRNCKNCFRVYSCCFVNINTVTYFNLFLRPFQQPECQSLFFKFFFFFFVFY